MTAAQEFFRRFYPNLTQEGKAKVDAIIAEWGISERDLTDAEIEEAGEILVNIVKRHSSDWKETP